MMTSSDSIMHGWVGHACGRSLARYTIGTMWTKRVIIRFMTHRPNELERERCEERCAASLDYLAG